MQKVGAYKYLLWMRTPSESPVTSNSEDRRNYEDEFNMRPTSTIFYIYVKDKIY